MTVTMYNLMDALIASSKLSWNALNHYMEFVKNVNKDGVSIIKMSVRRISSTIPIFLKFKKDVYRYFKIIVNCVK